MSESIFLTALFLLAAILPLVIIGFSLIFSRMMKNLVLSRYIIMVMYTILSLFSLADAINEYRHHANSSKAIFAFCEFIIWLGLAYAYSYWIKQIHLKQKENTANNSEGV